MYVLVKYFIALYLFGALWLCRVQGNFTISLNNSFKKVFMCGIDKFIKRVFKLKIQEKNFNMLGVLHQILIILFFLIIPISIKYLNNFISINLAGYYVKSFNAFCVHGWILYLILAIDALVYDWRN